jgi:hypothetical protein
MPLKTQDLINETQSAYRTKTGRLFTASDLIRWFNFWNARVEDEAQIESRIAETELVLDSSGRATLPNDCHSPALVRLGDTPYEPADYRTYTESSEQCIYRIIGSVIELPITNTTIQFAYYKKLASFTESNLEALLPVPDRFAESYVAYALKKAFERDKEFDLASSYAASAERLLHQAATSAQPSFNRVLG